MKVLQVPVADKGEDDVAKATRIFATYGSYIRRLIDFRVKDHTLAEDIFQDVFVSLVRNPAPRDVRNMKGYLYRRLMSEIIDALRRVERYQRHISKYTECRQDVSAEDCPEDFLAAVEERAKTFTAIASFLTRTEATVVTKRFRNGLDTQAVAVEMGVAPRTVSRYLSVALRKLRNSPLFAKGMQK